MCQAARTEDGLVASRAMVVGVFCEGILSGVHRKGYKRNPAKYKKGSSHMLTHTHSRETGTSLQLAMGLVGLL